MNSTEPDHEVIERLSRTVSRLKTRCDAAVAAADRRLALLRQVGNVLPELIDVAETEATTFKCDLVSRGRLALDAIAIELKGINDVQA